MDGLVANPVAAVTLEDIRENSGCHPANPVGKMETVVNGGPNTAGMRMLSNPTMLISSGMWRPSSWAAR